MDRPETFEDPGVIEELRATYQPFEADVRQRLRDQLIATPAALGHPTSTAAVAETRTRRPIHGQRLRLAIAAAILSVIGVGLSVSGAAGSAVSAAVAYLPFISSQPNLVLSCTATTWKATGSGRRIASPAEFKASGGKLIPRSVAQAARLPNPQYWIISKKAHVVDTCGGWEFSSVEIGTNEREGTQLLAISAVTFANSKQPVMVGFLLIPGPPGGCAPRPTRPPIVAPDGRPVAQLARVPAGFSRFIGVQFTPCGRPSRRPSHLPPPSTGGISFHILSEIRYRGNEGTVYVVTARASPLAMRRGLKLGNPAGWLPNGSRIWVQGNDVRWLKRGLIISVSGDVPLDRLMTLAADVVLK